MGLSENHGVRGRVWLTLKDARSGELVLERVAHNAVMTKGCELVAMLFCGQSIKPISAVGIGTEDAEPENGNLTALRRQIFTEDGGDIPERAEITDISVSTDDETGSATVKFEATFAAGQGNGSLKEAGIFNDLTREGVLYNRVIFPVITKTEDHELTLVWEITFSGHGGG